MKKIILSILLLTGTVSAYDFGFVGINDTIRFEVFCYNVADTMRQCKPDSVHVNVYAAMNGANSAGSYEATTGATPLASAWFDSAVTAGGNVYHVLFIINTLDGSDKANGPFAGCVKTWKGGFQYPNEFTFYRIGGGAGGAYDLAREFRPDSSALLLAPYATIAEQMAAAGPLVDSLNKNAANFDTMGGTMAAAQFETSVNPTIAQTQAIIDSLGKNNNNLDSVGGTLASAQIEVPPLTVAQTQTIVDSLGKNNNNLDSVGGTLASAQLEVPPLTVAQTQAVVDSLGKNNNNLDSLGGTLANAQVDADVDVNVGSATTGAYDSIDFKDDYWVAVNSGTATVDTASIARSVWDNDVVAQAGRRIQYVDSLGESTTGMTLAELIAWAESDSGLMTAADTLAFVSAVGSINGDGIDELTFKGTLWDSLAGLFGNPYNYKGTLFADSATVADSSGNTDEMFLTNMAGRSAFQNNRFQNHLLTFTSGDYIGYTAVIDTFDGEVIYISPPLDAGAPVFGSKFVIWNAIMDTLGPVASSGQVFGDTIKYIFESVGYDTAGQEAGYQHTLQQKMGLLWDDTLSVLTQLDSILVAIANITATVDLPDSLRTMIYWKIDSLIASVGWDLNTGSILHKTSLHSKIAEEMLASEQTLQEGQDSIKAAIGAIDVATGNGSNLLTLYASDGSAMIQGVQFTLHPLASASYYTPSLTNDSGVTYIGMANGTYYVTTTEAFYGQDVLPDTVVVSGATTDTILFTATFVNVGMCQIRLETEQLTGAVVKGAKFTATPLLKGSTWRLSDGTLILPKSYIAYTNSAGLCTLTVYQSGAVKNNNGDSLTYNMVMEKKGTEDYFKAEWFGQVIPDTSVWDLR